MPGYGVSSAFSNGKDMYNPLPNPADQWPGSAAAQMAALFPEQSQQAGALAGNYSATQDTRDKVAAGAVTLGWKFNETTLEYNITGDSDWTPFVKQLTDAGVQLVSWTGTCLPVLRLFAQTAEVQLHLHPAGQSAGALMAQHGTEEAGLEDGDVHGKISSPTPLEHVVAVRRAVAVDHRADGHDAGIG